MGIYRAIDKSGKLLETFIGLENVEEAEAKMNLRVTTELNFLKERWLDNGKIEEMIG